ncbi:hypothetical protein chiPu_0022698 [Chiloscyllium punctatum]|uniref:Uncharacterized protein n=1 Tax=Chiloscyllium punctatum TaxID=137246 RepID=A0A401T8J2_CHIPU|nr:hypothetical protein [Chiloscyllium punctatum]
MQWPSKEPWRNDHRSDGIKKHSWEEAKDTNVKDAWNKLCPQFAHGFREEDITKAWQAVADIGNTRRQLNINEDDVLDLLESHAAELRTLWNWSSR